MRTFYAAGENNEHLWAPGFNDVLVSFASATVQKKPPRNPQWFLDCGAFSFFQSGDRDGTHVLPKYIDYLKGPAKGHEIYAAMDVIGSAEGTWRNDVAMRAEGLNPLAVVHFDEPHETIIKYLEAGITYIALGGYAGGGIKPRQAMRWINAVFAHIRDHYQKTGVFVKTHGFGMMDEAILLSYPFYSVDSTVWLISQRYGKVVLWDTEKVQLAQINPKQTELFHRAWRDYDLPLALIDGVIVPDAKNLKSAWNIWNILDLAEFVTDVWTKRGITWDDNDQWQASVDAERAFLLENYPLAVERRKPWRKTAPWNKPTPVLP